MAKSFKTGLIITGDADGGVRAIRATSSELGKLGRNFDTGGRKAQRFSRDTEAADQRLETLRNTALGVGSAIAGAFAVRGLSQQAAMISETDALAKSLRTSTSELQAWQYAGEQVGIQGDKMGDIFKDVSDKIGDLSANDGGEAKDLFEKMNLDIKEMVRLSPDKQLERIAGSLENLNASERTNFMESIADDAVRLNPLLEDGGRLLKEYTAEARNLGVAMNQVDIEAAVEADRAIQQLTATGRGMENMLLAEFGPGLNSAAQGMTTLIASMRDDEITATEQAIKGATGAAAGLAAVVVTVRGGLLAATAAQWAFNAALRANPIMLAVGALGALAGALVSTNSHLSETEREAKQTSREIRGLAEGFALLTEQQQINRRAEVAGDLAEWRLQASKLSAEISKLNALAKESGQLNEQGGAQEIITPEQMARGREARKELAALTTNIEAGTETLDKMDKILEDLGGSGGSVRDFGDASEDAAKKLEKQKEAAKSLLDGLYPVLASQREYAEQKGNAA